MPNRAAQKSRIALVKCAAYKSAEVAAALEKAFALLGGIGVFITPGSKVLVKPNLLMAVPASSGIVTHPEVVRAVIRELKKINCRVLLGDGPSAMNLGKERVERVYEATGMRLLAEQEGVELVRFEKHRMRKGVPLSALLDECDALVNVPKFKTHTLMFLSGAVKNLYGLVSGPYKTELHRRYFRPEQFAEVLADIYGSVKPALTVIDGIVAMEGDGPGTGGRLRSQGVLLVGRDCVALDSALAFMAGVKPEGVLSNRAAARKGLGNCDLNAIEVLGEALEAVCDSAFRPPSTSITAAIPGFLLAPLQRLMRFFKPKIDRLLCVRCGECVKICPVKAVRFIDGYPRVEQGKCISCFCCHETCPARAIKIAKSWLARLMRL